MCFTCGEERLNPATIPNVRLSTRATLLLLDIVVTNTSPAISAS